MGQEMSTNLGDAKQRAVVCGRGVQDKSELLVALSVNTGRAVTVPGKPVIGPGLARCLSTPCPWECQI